MRRLLPVIAMAVYALAAPAWASCSVQAYEAGICPYPTPDPSASQWQREIDEADRHRVDEERYRRERDEAEYRRQRDKLDAHFDAIFAAEAQSRWWPR